MSDTLIVTSVASGAELGRVSLVDGKLVFSNTTVENLFGGLRKRRLSDTAMFELRAGWSNGYLRFTRAE